MWPNVFYRGPDEGWTEIAKTSGNTLYGAAPYEKPNRYVAAIKNAWDGFRERLANWIYSERGKFN